MYTVEFPNNEQIGSRPFVLYMETRVVPSGGKGGSCPPINRNTRCKMAAKQENQVRLLTLSLPSSHGKRT